MLPPTPTKIVRSEAVMIPGPHPVDNSFFKELLPMAPPTLDHLPPDPLAEAARNYPLNDYFLQLETQGQRQQPPAAESGTYPRWSPLGRSGPQPYAPPPLVHTATTALHPLVPADAAPQSPTTPTSVTACSRTSIQFLLNPVDTDITAQPLIRTPTSPSSDAGSTLSASSGGGKARKKSYSGGETGVTKPPTRYICNHQGCGKDFKRNEHLKRHFATHTNQKPFACSFKGCLKRFARRDNLRQHYKTHLRQQQRASQSATVLGFSAQPIRLAPAPTAPAVYSPVTSSPQL
ncbi:hypothetical protein H4R34_001548 [Dimargaris verticillata]|uniref:C2H2-type domain-containing protein n=1 Tax=Dimargaris verticillata TaxID=2761393 RepID=A0A9W8EEW0_9FUNG|nr:hypothetical protein H4R34_001548 [Dimargaris verticillata]